MDRFSKRDLAQHIAYQFRWLSLHCFSEAQHVALCGYPEGEFSSFSQEYVCDLFLQARLYRHCAVRYEQVANSSWRSLFISRTYMESYVSFLAFCPGPCVLID